MGVQQLIANNTNALIDSAVVASTVSPSAEITRTGMTRAGTGLVELAGLYTGHVSADYDIEIVSGAGNGRASAPVFSGVGSGTLSVTAADLPAQDITVTLLTPPYPGATAEARIGADIVKAASVGSTGNMISITVNRSGLSFAASGSSTLEEINEGSDELTVYKWDIPGVVCSTDLKGNVPADAPRVRFGSDPTIYRVVKDGRSGSLKTILSPAAVRPIPAGSAIWITTGTYTVTVTNGTTTETYTSITTGYDLLSALLSSTLVQPAYTPAPVTTVGGNAAVDLPLVTGSMALLTDSSSAGVRPAEITARSTASADTIRLQSKGNGAWSVTGASGTVYPDALEGQPYAPAASPILLTIPTKPQPVTATATQPVFLADVSYADREYDDDPATLPLLCIDGALGINASPKTITATYTKRPSAADCPCPTDTAYWNSSCLGLTNSVLGEDIMSLDPAYQTRLVSLYAWQKSFIEGNSEITGGSGGTSTTTEYLYDVAMWGLYQNLYQWWTLIPGLTLAAANNAISGTLYAIIDDDPTKDWKTQLDALYPDLGPTSYTVFIRKPVTSSEDYVDTGYTLDANDIRLVQSVTQIMADCLAQIWGDATGCTAWDTQFAAVQADMAALMSTGKLSTSAPAEIISRFQSGADYVLTTAGIVPGKSNTSSGMQTGCWEDSDAQYWWMLSDGYAPAFTGVEYYSTRAGTFENSQEFGFMIKCSCPDLLMEGDQLTIQIGAGLAASVWSSNEFLEITTIPTTPLYLAGGKDADDSETWSVSAKDSSNAALPVANFDSTNRSYSSGGLAFTLATGGIPYSVGDRFTFTVEGGTFKWRKDGGTWSAATAIADNTLIDSGLYASFLSGSAPSFVAGDSYSFRADQKSSAARMLIPDVSVWSWPDATATVTLTMPAARPIAALSLVHSLPAGTAIAVDYWDDTTSAFKVLSWAGGVVRDYLHIVTGAAVTTTKIRIITDSPGAIRWLWAGVPFQPVYSGSLRLRKQYDMLRAKQSGSAVLLGEGTGATLAWDILDEDDADRLLSLVRSVKTAGDQPVILIPQHLHPEEAVVCRLADDGIEISDILDYQPDNTSHRILSASMELTPEWR